MSGAPSFRVTLALRVAWRDLVHGWRAAACLIAAAAIALAPVLLLFGLNYGFVNGLIDQLRKDPRTRELRPIGQYELTAAWFAERAADPRIGFILPRTRYLASSARIRPAEGAGVAEAELIPTAPGDPLAPPGAAVEGLGEAYVSASVAAKMELAPGDGARLIVTRQVGGRREREEASLTIVGVVDRGLHQRDSIFISPDLLEAVERWREGAAVPALGWEGEARDAARISYAGFRMFARDVRDVPALQAELVAASIDARTEADAIRRALAIESGLTWLFVVILALSSGGVLLTLGFQLAAAISEKSSEFATLRMLGMLRYEVALVPMAQGAMIAAAGAALASIVVLAAQPAVNARLGAIAGFDGPVSLLGPAHAAIAIAAMAAAGALTGVVAGRRAADLEPAEGLRRD